MRWENRLILVTLI